MQWLERGFAGSPGTLHATNRSYRQGVPEHTIEVGCIRSLPLALAER